MAPKNQTEPRRPAKLPSRPRETTKIQKGTQNGTKRTQPNPLLFVNVSDPAESKRQDSRKAVRSFVMKQYKQSQKTYDPLQMLEMELDKGKDDAVEDALVRSQVVKNTNISQSPSWPDNSCDVEEISMTSRQHHLSSPSLAHTRQRSSPLSILSSGSLDPFDSYPAQIDMRAQQLVHMCTCKRS